MTQQPQTQQPRTQPRLCPQGDGLWLADGPVVTGAGGFRFPTRMAVLRLKGEDGGLMLWSPVALDRGLRAAVEALGPVRHLVAPNGVHHMAMGDWQAAFPQAWLSVAPGVAGKRPDLRIDATLGATVPGWAGQIDQQLVAGRITTEAVFFHRASGSALVTDLIQQMPQGWYRGWRGLVARLDAMSAPHPAMPRKFRLSLAGRPKARAALREVAAWPVRQLVMAHGPVVTAEARAILRAALRPVTG